MTVNRKVTGNAMSMGQGIGLGIVVSLVITLAGSMLVAWLIGREMIPEIAVGYGAMMILILGSMAGAWTAVLKIKHRKLLVCGMSGVGYYISLLAMTALLFGGQYQGMGVTALVILCGVGVTALIACREPKIKRKNYKKLRYG